MEAEHPLDTRMRLLVRAMRNAVSRQKALQDHMIINKKFKNPSRRKRSRRDTAADAGAAAAGE